MSLLEKLKQFTLSPYYIGLAGLICFTCWFFDALIVGIAILAALFSICLIAFKDTSSALPPLILCTFAISRQLFVTDYMPIILGVAPVVLLSIALHFVLHRPKLKGGKFILGLLLASAAMIMGGIGFDWRAENILVVAGFCLLIVFVYVFFYSTAGEKLKEVALNSFVASVMVLLLQITAYYFRQEDVVQAVVNKSLNVGWGISNNIAFVLSMLLPVLFYKTITSRLPFFYLALACLDYFGIIFTMSRGNIIFGGLFMLFGMVFSFIKSRQKGKYLIALAVSLAIIAALAIAFKDVLVAVYEWLLEIKLDARGRVDLIKEGFEAFKSRPVFGIGFFHMHAEIPHWFHNSLVQILTSTGIVGSLLFIPFFYQRYMVVARNFNLCSFMMACSILLSGLYALMECNFFFVYNLAFIMVEYIIIERERDTVDLLQEIKERLFKRKASAR